MLEMLELKLKAFELGHMPKYWAGLNAEVEADAFLQQIRKWFQCNTNYCVIEAAREFRLLYTEEGDTVRYSLEELVPSLQGPVFCVAYSLKRGGFWSDPIPLSNWRDTAAF